MADFLTTTIGTSVFSPLARHIAKSAFAILRRLPDTPLKHRMIGVAVMTAVASWWIVGIGTGWTLVYAGFGQSVLDDRTGQIASFLGAASHVGHLLSTVGGGIMQASSIEWSLLGVLVGVNGMVVLTLSVSFVLTTTQAVVHGRAFLIKLDAISELDDNTAQPMIFELADLVAALNAAPFGLYYSAVRVNRRLPAGLFELTRKWTDTERTEIRNILAELPWLELDDDADLSDAIDAWAKRYAA